LNCPKFTPAQDQVRIRVHAATVNPTDVISVFGFRVARTLDTP
jgi:NADPH:quinone reductase-like Zn-dependent oxidoreductase